MQRAMKRLDEGDMPELNVSSIDVETLNFQLDINLMATLKRWGWSSARPRTAQRSPNS